MRILGKLPAHDLLEVDRGRRNLAAPERAEGGDAARPRDQPPVGRDHDRMQQPDLFDVAGERSDVAQIPAVALADDDLGDSARQLAGAIVHAAGSSSRHGGRPDSRFSIRLDWAAAYMRLATSMISRPRSGYRVAIQS
jgi:hypothetical protein